MTKISGIVLVVIIFVLVSITYTHFYNQDLDNNTLSNLSQPVIAGNATVQTELTIDDTKFTYYTPIEFFIDMFTFSVPDIPYFFSVIWWVLLIIFGLCVFLVIRGG